MKENKTSASQIKASMNYDKKNRITTIACKINKDKKILIEQHYKKNGYKSMNEYLLALIEKDISD